MRKPIFNTVLGCLLLLVLTAGLSSSAQAADEQLQNKLKAAFLLNFAKFTRWPEDVTNSGEFRLCLVGKNPLGGAADDLSGKMVGGRPIKVTVKTDVSEVVTCDMLYISPSAEGSTAELINACGGKARLTVSDRRDFAAEGGIIELRIFNNRLGFIINNTRAKLDSLSLTAALLDLAQEVL